MTCVRSVLGWLRSLGKQEAGGRQDGTPQAEFAQGKLMDSWRK
jgi:hypothetical protein